MFTSEIVSGIENLYDIENDIKGEIDGFNLNQIVEIIGCMLREQKKSIYFQMNLLPEDIKRKYYKSEKALKYLKAVPIVILILSVPIIVLGAMDIMKQKELDLAKSKLEEIKNEYGQISKIEEEIKSTEEEIKLYDMLIQKEPKWGAILSSIDKNIPYKVQLDNLSLSYVAENNTKNQNNEQVQNENNSQDNGSSTTQNTEQNEKMYDKVPNFISITGQASTPSLVGQFVYNLKALTYFEDIKLSGVTEQSSGNDDSKKTSYSFSITAKVKDGVIISE
ncbi:PilN domain-containing protein [Romboutsia ilealis]|uniref:PilN domain-containing protein n=1 Tax=Romboutsia ilealis TaxID=1115758 RepID=UPI0025726C15|nr:PilN domain-containing protein [Romboutsia ilealis]